MSDQWLNLCTTASGFKIRIPCGLLQGCISAAKGTDHERRSTLKMQASHLDVRQGGSHFGPVEAFQSNILQGNFNGLTINATVAAQVAASAYEGHYSYSSLQPVPNYVQRPALHEKLRRQFHQVQTRKAEEPRIGVVWGLERAGKSQLVRHYIHTYRQDYSAVFWIEAGSKESIERDYIQMYRLLYGRSLGAGQETLKVDDAVPAVKRWFYGRKGRWLVVLDSADSIDDDADRSYINLQYFMPDACGVHIIITSRSSTVKEMTALEAVEVADMESLEAAELFQRCAKIQDPGPDIKMEVSRIVEELGCLALAITLAGSYVSATPRLSSDIRRYLPEYRQRRKELLHRRPQQQIHRYGESVLSTWEASFDAVAMQSPPAARLLGVLASMNFDDIFLRMFDQNADGVSPQPDTAPSPAQTWRSFLFLKVEWSLYLLESALEVLQRYALIQWRSDQQSYSMHKLVHAWGQDRLDREMQWQTSRVALELLADATADDQLSPSCKLRVVSHLMVNFSIYLERSVSTREVKRDRLALIGKVQSFLYAIGRWSEAYEVQAFHLRKTKETLGKKHPSTLTSMNNLALVLRSQGKHEGAEQMHRQTLTLRETVLGKKHPDTLTSMNNLALVLSSQGKHEEAEQMHRQELALCETVLGKEHPDTLTSMTNLAEVLRSQGKHEEAEQMHRQTLALMKMVLGKEHPSTLTSMNNLALMLRSQGKHEEAEQMHRQTLTLRETVLSKKHPNTLTSMNNLALVLSNQGKHEEAEQMHRQTLTLTTFIESIKAFETRRDFFDRQRILEELITSRYEESDNIVNFDENIEMLRSFSLVALSVENDVFEMHRLMQFATKK